MKHISYDTSYNRHIKAARKAARGLTGYARAEAIYQWFSDNSDHPHPGYTFTQTAANRSQLCGSDHQFAVYILQNMADICAKNEAGYYHDGQRYQHDKCLGFGADLYSQNGANSPIAVCVDDKNVKTFSDSVEYENFVDSLYRRSGYQRSAAQTGLLVASFINFINCDDCETKEDHAGCAVWAHDNDNDE